MGRLRDPGAGLPVDQMNFMQRPEGVRHTSCLN